MPASQMGCAPCRTHYWNLPLQKSAKKEEAKKRRQQAKKKRRDKRKKALVDSECRRPAAAAVPLLSLLSAPCLTPPPLPSAELKNTNPDGTTKIKKKKKKKAKKVPESLADLGTLAEGLDAAAAAGEGKEARKSGEGVDTQKKRERITYVVLAGSLFLLSFFFPGGAAA